MRPDNAYNGAQGHRYLAGMTYQGADKQPDPDLNWQLFGNSMTNRIYVWLAGLWDVHPDYVQIGLFILALVIYLSSWAVMFSYLKPPGALIALCLAASLSLCTTAISCDLFRLGFGMQLFQRPFIYCLLTTLFIPSFALALRRQWYLAGLSLGLFSMVHLVWAFFAGLGCAGMAIGMERKHYWQALCGGLIAAAMAVGWMGLLLWTGPTTNVVMDTDSWHFLMRMGNVHFFPFDLNVFTSRASEYIVPLISLFLLAFNWQNLASLNEFRRRAWLGGTLLLTSVSLLGVLLSKTEVSIFLTQLSLHRASVPLIVILFAMVIPNCYRILTSDNLVKKNICALLLIGPFWGYYGFPVLLSMVLSLWQLQNWKSIPFYFRCLLAIIWSSVATYLIWLWWDQGWTPLPETARTALAVYAATATVITVSALDFAIKRGASDKAIPALLALVLTLYGAWQWLEAPNRFDTPRNRAYLAAQLWARDNTSPDAIFFKDPTIPYGWREYSQRTSLGGAREWVHNYVLYNPSVSHYTVGVHRMGLLGIDLSAFIQARKGQMPPSSIYQKLMKKVKYNYNQLDEKDLSQIAESEGVSYFIFTKQKGDIPKGAVVYENDFYKIITSQR